MSDTQRWSVAYWPIFAAALVLLVLVTSMQSSLVQVQFRPTHTRSAYDIDVRRNLSEYKHRLYAESVGLLGYPGNKPWNWQQDWGLFKAIISCPANRPLKRYGKAGDGGKWLCELGTAPELMRGGSGANGSCVIYSLGSRGDFSFEEAMLNATLCEVHTFDCTSEARTVHPTRHIFHPWCLGEAPAGSDKQWRTWWALTTELNHSRVDLLKMDIEGAEYAVFSEFHANDTTLPVELSVELHQPPTQAPRERFAITFMHLSNLGYAAYSQEVNMEGPECCSEFTFRRIEIP